MRTLFAANLEARTLRGIMRRAMTQDSRNYADGLRSSSGLEGEPHEVIEHADTLIRWPDVHTKAIKSRWAHTKPDVLASHYSVSLGLLHDYMADNDLLFNDRQGPDCIRTGVQKLIAY